MASNPSGLPQTAQQWISRWRTKPLAMLSNTRERLDALRDTDGDPSPADLAKIVQTDPFLCYLLLKAVNNRQRGKFSSEVIGIENALKLVGVQRFIEQFGHLPLIEERLPPSTVGYAVLMQQILIARQAAAFAWEWAVARLDLKPEEIYSAALLHNQAWCQLALNEPQLANSWLPWHASALQNEEAAQQQLLHMPLAQLQLALMQNDNIPPSLLELIALEPAPNPRALIVGAAAAVSAYCVSGWQHPQLQSQLANIAQNLRRDEDEVWARAKRIAIDFARNWQYSVVPAAARWLPLLPGSWAETASSKAAKSDSVTLQPTAALVFEDVVREIKSHLDRSLTFNQMMSLIIKGLHDGLQLDRVVFALLSGSRQQIKARYVVGAGATDPLARFEFDLQAPNLLSKLMQKTAGIWLNSDNAAQFRRHLPTGWSDCVGDAEFFAMSLFVGDQAVGLIVADRAGKRPLDEAGYNGFKQMCLMGAQGLAHLANKSATTTASP